jgi:predicted nucleic acid-binding protein
LLLDTNRYSDLQKGIPEVIDAVGRAKEVYVAFVVLAELHFGFRRGSKRADNERRLQSFLSQPGVQVLWPDATTVSIVADLSVQLAKQGTPIPPHDIWIAALAVQHGLTLYARDKHFDHLPQVARL